MVTAREAREPQSLPRLQQSFVRRRQQPCSTDPRLVIEPPVPVPSPENEHSRDEPPDVLRYEWGEVCPHNDIKQNTVDLEARLTSSISMLGRGATRARTQCGGEPGIENSSAISPAPGSGPTNRESPSRPPASRRARDPLRQARGVCHSLAYRAGGTEPAPQAPGTRSRPARSP